MLLGCFIHKEPRRKPATLVHSTSEVGGRLQSNLPPFISHLLEVTGYVSQVLAIYFLYMVLPQMELRRLISNGDWQSPIRTIVTGRKQIAKMTLGLVLAVY